MTLKKSTPDGEFTIFIQSRTNEGEGLIPGESLYQLVQLLEQTAQTIRLAVDPDLQRQDV